MRIGFFGGSFDPPHRGHLRVALAAKEAFALERVLLAPTGSQPLKPAGLQAEYADRLAMVRLLVEGVAGVGASEIDAPREGGEPNFTVDTLVRLRDVVGAGTEVFAVVGIDAFLDVRRWREPEKLFELAEWVVVSRPGFDMADVDGLGLSPWQRGRVRLLEGVAEDVSATAVREALREGVGVEEFLPESVVEYIRARGLYHAE